MRMTREQWDALVAHAREEAPKECLGWLKLRDGAVEEVVRATDESQTWRYGFRLDGKDLFAVYQAEEDGWQIAIYHSHPRSEPRPSQQDVNEANYPDRVWVIVSLAGDDPEVRAWWIDEHGRVEEEEIHVER
jgi:[CysO sulfur-carrier protein]-S-L-cysteine hydrolase